MAPSDPHSPSPTPEISELPPQKKRVVIFGSFERGYAILRNLLEDKELREKIEIVGLVTDDPSKGYTNAKNRMWRYADDDERALIAKRIEDLAKNNGIPVYKV